MRSVNEARIRSDREPGPSFEVLARRHIKRGSARRADAVRAYAEDDRWAICRFGDRNKRKQRMDLSDFRVVFEADMNARMPPIYER